MMARSFYVLLAVASCSQGSNEIAKQREDRDVLRALLSRDGRTMEALDPVVETLGTGTGDAEASVRLRGPIASLARDAARRARRAAVTSRKGRRLRSRILGAFDRRLGVVELYAKAAESGRPDELLEAIRQLRALEEQTLELDLEVEALPEAR